MSSMRTLRAWVEKATGSDYLTSIGGFGKLANAQAKEFIRVATEWTAILSEAREENSDAPAWEVPTISLHGTRILKSGTDAAEGARVATGQMVRADSAMVTITTALFKGESKVSDESLEDNIEGAAHADTLMQLIGEAVGRDMEEIAIKGDTALADTAGVNRTFRQFDGIFKVVDAALAGGAQEVVATGVTDPETILKNLLEKIPARYRKDPTRLRLYVPIALADAYEDAMSARGTPLGDVVLENGRAVKKYRGVPVVPTPLLSGTDVGSQNFGRVAFCTDPKNIIFAWHRRIRIEKFRDPREGVWSFLPTVRFAAKVPQTAACTYTKTMDSI